MYEGKVKWYNETKGFGFIEMEGRKDVFVHRSGLVSAYAGLTEGQNVVFDIKQGGWWGVAYSAKCLSFLLLRLRWVAGRGIFC